jgi:hypothetical protein
MMTYLMGNWVIRSDKSFKDPFMEEEAEDASSVVSKEDDDEC